VWKKLTQLTVSYNARTVSTVEEVQQIYQQTTRSRQKTARRPVTKKCDRPIDGAVFSLIK
jgi:hypothetical protein